MHGWDLYLGAIFVYPLPYYITFSQVRYRNALEPLLLLLIAYMVARQFPDPSTSELATNLVTTSRELVYDKPPITGPT